MKKYLISILCFAFIICASGSQAWIGLLSGRGQPGTLSVDQQATYIDVASVSGDFVFRLYKDSQTYGARIYDSTKTTVYGYFLFRVSNGGDSLEYYMSKDDDRTTTINTNTSSLVEIEVDGNYDYDGSTYLTNSTSVEYLFTITDAYVKIEVTWVTSANINMEASNNQATIGYIDGTVTNPTNIAEISGEEVYHEQNGPSNPDLTRVDRYGSSDYIGPKADELRLRFWDDAHSDDSDYGMYLHDEGEANLRWYDNATFPSGTHTMDSTIYIYVN